MTGAGGGLPAAGTRIECLDVLRGVAVLGMLLVNILGFGLPGGAMRSPTVDAATGGADYAAYVLVWLFAEGGMRALFSILFGAGLVLLTHRLAATGRSESIFLWRCAWLVVIGLVDAFVLLWTGDILVAYGVAGLILFPFRDLRPGPLIAIGLTLIVMPVVVPALVGQSLPVVGVEDAASEVAARRGSYLHNVVTFAPEAMRAILAIPGNALWDVLGPMYLGMGLYGARVLDGSRSARFYLWLGVLGFAVALPVNGLELYCAAQSGYDATWTSPVLIPTYPIGRLGLAAGYLGVVMSACRDGVAGPLAHRLACVGRMALTCYLTHSLLAVWLFTGAGFGWFDTLSRAALYVVVVAVWAMQLWSSAWWLARFHRGPVEFLWRSLAERGAGSGQPS